MRDVCIMLIINGWLRNIIMGAYGTFLFSTIRIQSYVEPTGSWRLDFGHVSFVTSVRQSDVEDPGYWWLDSGNPGS